ncbi:MAG TPA: DUF6259 domain-containing protein [Tepidisphaeraceae bacterium]|jgi:hypothetical protein
MKHRCLLAAWVIWLGMGSLAPAAVTLEDNSVRVDFDANSGALVHLENKSTGWVIERRPDLGVSFRLHAPLPNQRDNFVLGQKQRAVSVQKISDHEIRIEWKNLASEHGGNLPIDFISDVTLQNGALKFVGTLINDSPLMIETIDYPYFGDLSAPARDAEMQFHTAGYGGLTSDEIYPVFENEKGYCSVAFPTKMIDSRKSLFGLIQSTDQGIYLETEDHTQPYMVEYTFEQHPGYVDAIDHLVPKEDAISGMPVHLEFRTCHYIFEHPHSTKNLMPIVVQPYRGDWHAGADIYKQWRATWFKPAHVPAWAQDVNSWLQLQINAPEDNHRVAYRDLLPYGEECAANGVSAIQLVGWNKGGQDGGDPAQNTEPALGTREDLRKAISDIQARGVKMILFAKLNWADLTTDWYKKELYKYQMTDPYGVPYQQHGYSYYTPTQLADINTHRRAVMDMLSPGYRDIAGREFNKVLDLGAAGWLWDEVSGHGQGVLYNFAPGHGYEPPGYIYAGDLPMAQQLRAAADKMNPDYLFAGEAVQDWLMQYYPLSYFRIGGSEQPVQRYIDPQAPLMVAVTGFDDRAMLNMILLDRYIISYEPFNFKGHVTDFPLTLAYGKKIDALRRKYKSYLWDADFRDTLGAKVEADGRHRYSVFQRPDGKRAVVIISTENSKTVTATVQLPHAGVLVSATPEKPDDKPCDGSVTIPPRSAVVVMEQ